MKKFEKQANRTDENRFSLFGYSLLFYSVLIFLQNAPVDHDAGRPTQFTVSNEKAPGTISGTGAADAQTRQKTSSDLRLFCLANNRRSR